jgi:hypothetical protein
MYRQAVIAVMCVGLLAGAQDAAAQVGQDWTDRGFVNLNVAFETTSGALDGGRTFRLYDENGTTNVRQDVDSGPLFDFSVGVRVWRNATVGIAYHHESTTGQGTAEASVPNPAFTDRLRPVSLNVTDLGRSEQALHLQFGYMIPVMEQLSVHVFLGPSFFSLSQDVITDLTFQETSFPFTTVNATASAEEVSEGAVGFHVGADVTYQFYETTNLKLGAGAFLRYAGATVDIPVLDNTVGSDVGGIQVGFGARLRF